MDINKFTEKAREAVTQAQSIAVGMGHQDIDSEHLALALIRQEQGIVPRILEQMGVQTAALAVAVEEKLRKRPSVSGGGMDPNRISITQRLAKVLGDAENESRRMKDEYVSVDHLFAALAENAPGTPLGEVFKEYNISRASFGQAMESLRGGARVTSPTPEDTVEALSKYARDLVEAARQGKMDPVIGRDAEILREDETPAALDLGDKVGIDRLVRRAVGVAHMRRHGADDKAVFQLKVADLAGLKYFFQFHSIPPVLHAHAGSGRCAAAWAIAIVGLFLPKNLCDFNNALFCNDEPKSKYIQKSS